MISTGPRSLTSALILTVLVLAGCGHTPPRMPPLVAATPVEAQPAPPVEAPPHDEQMLTDQRRPVPPMPEPAPPTPQLETPDAVIAYANAKARQTPALDQYINAVQRWTYHEGTLYQVYVRPYRVTAILLSTDEQLLDFPVGDARADRWLFTRTARGEPGAIQDVLAVSPQYYGMVNNLIILTTKRTYAIELISPPYRKHSEHGNAYMVQVAWSYPEVEATKRQDALQERRLQHEEAAAMQLDISQANFRYTIRPKTRPAPPWMPLSVFDDREKVYIRFPDTLHTTEAPVLYVDADRAGKHLVNYRKQGTLYIVDRLFNAAELRVGGNTSEADVVQIRRTEAP